MVATLDPSLNAPGGANADLHLHHHGLNDSAQGGQDFRDSLYGNGCYQGEIGRATLGASRWHARGHEQFGGEIHQDRAGWSLVAMTPHWDQDVSGCHAVPENYNGTGVSGFVAARQHIVDAWLASGHHVVVDIQTWGNTQSIEQGCGTGWLPRSNGLVYFLGLEPD
jgi:hypothetical protein